MGQYFFQGTVLPERAQLSHKVSFSFTHPTSAFTGTANVSIILNQVAVWIESSDEWDIFDLRNVVRNIVQGQLNKIGYLTGLAYDLRIDRVLNQDREIDYVFGIAIPCIADRRKSLDLNAEFSKLQNKTGGQHGILINRCLNDLISAMKHADDTGFYCYRAIESLRHYCAALHNISASSKKIQWTKFREVIGCNEEAILFIKQAADPLRHGEYSNSTSDDRTTLLTKTWDIVDKYFSNI